MALPECKAPGNGKEKVDSCGSNEHPCLSAWASEGGSEVGEERGNTESEGYACPFSSPGAPEGQTRVPKPLVTAQSHPSPGGCASCIYLSLLILHFTNSFCERQAGPRGAVSLCPCPWEAEKEKGRRRRRSSRRDRPGCGKQLAETGKLLSLCACLWQLSCLQVPGLQWGCAPGQAGGAQARESLWAGGGGLGAGGPGLHWGGLPCAARPLGRLIHSMGSRVGTLCHCLPASLWCQ